MLRTKTCCTRHQPRMPPPQGYMRMPRSSEERCIHAQAKSVNHRTTKIRQPPHRENPSITAQTKPVNRRRTLLPPSGAGLSVESRVWAQHGAHTVPSQPLPLPPRPPRPPSHSPPTPVSPPQQASGVPSPSPRPLVLLPPQRRSSPHRHRERRPPPERRPRLLPRPDWGSTVYGVAWN